MSNTYIIGEHLKYLEETRKHVLSMKSTKEMLLQITYDWERTDANTLLHYIMYLEGYCTKNCYSTEGRVITINY